MIKENYILITDIGRDTDDTLALLILLYLHKLDKIKLLAIAVSGSKLQNRGNSVYYWLSKFRIIDIAVIIPLEEQFNFEPIDIDERTNKIIKDIDSNVCILPYTKKTFKTNINKYDNLHSFFETNETNNINIISIAPIRPLYIALKTNPKIINRISNIYFQGNIYYENNSIIPDIRSDGRGAYNFGNGFPNSQEIKDETKYVIDLFEKTYINNDINKLYFLGKNTAYLINFNLKDLLFINKKIAILSVKKTLLFAKNLPNVFNMVFKNNIIYTNKLKLIRKYKKHIDKLNISKYINNIKDRLNRLNRLKSIVDQDKINYLNNELYEIQILLNNIKNNNEYSNDSYYKLFIRFLIDPNNINNKYTKDFLTTINKITNAYDLVLIYLVLYKDFYNLKESKILTENDKIYNKSKHIQFNEKNSNIFNVKKIKNHMKKLLRKSLQ